MPERVHFAAFVLTDGRGIVVPTSRVLEIRLAASGEGGTVVVGPASAPAGGGRGESAEYEFLIHPPGRGDGSQPPGKVGHAIEAVMGALEDD